MIHSLEQGGLVLGYWWHLPVSDQRSLKLPHVVTFDHIWTGPRGVVALPLSSFSTALWKCWDPQKDFSITMHSTVVTVLRCLVPNWALQPQRWFPYSAKLGVKYASAWEPQKPVCWAETPFSNSKKDVFHLTLLRDRTAYFKLQWSQFTSACLFQITLCWGDVLCHQRHLCLGHSAGCRRSVPRSWKDCSTWRSRFKCLQPPRWML